MNIILKKARKDFKNLGWRRYLILGTVISCLAGGLSLYYAIVAALPTLNQYFDTVNHADYTYQLSDTTWINQTQLDNIDEIKKVDDYTGRLFWQTSIKLPDQKDRKYILLVGLDPNIKWPKVYNYTINSGKNFNKGDNNLSVVVDNTFAEKNDLKTGDKLEVDGLNNANLKISGLCNAPEFIGLTSNPEFLLPMEGSMGIVFLSQVTLKNYIIDYLIWFNQTTPEDLSPMILYYQTVDYNNIAVTFKEGIGYSEGNKAVKNFLEEDCNVDIDDSVKFEDSYAYKLMEADVRDTGRILIMILIFMALMGGIIVYIIFNRYVYSQKQQLGILLALGYTKRDTLKYFLFNILFISIIAIPTGIFLGFTLGYVMINYMLVEMANVALFYFPFIFIPDVLYMGLIIGIGIVFLSTYFSVRKINNRIISELIFEQAEVTQKIKKIKEYSRKSRSISNKLVFRNLFRNKKRLIFTMIAMTFSLIIVSASQSLIDSMYYNVNKTFKNPNTDVEPNQKWDLNVDFQTNVNMSLNNSLVDDISNLKGVKDIKLYTQGLATVKDKDKQDLSFGLLGIDLKKEDDFHSFTWYDSNDKNSIPIKSNEIVISSVQALKLEKKIGDKIEIKNSAGENFKFKIVGIQAELIMVNYITLDAGKDVFYNGSNLIDGLYLILDNNADKKQIKDEIYNLGNVEVIFDAEEMNKEIMAFMENYTPFIQFIVAFSLTVSFFIVFYNAIMNIYDKNYEYGILRSLGYPKKSIFRMILFENLLQGLIPILLALLLTYPIALEMGQSYQEDFPLQIVVGISAILMITIPPLILYTLGSFIGLRTVYKQNLYEQVQTRFVG